METAARSGARRRLGRPPIALAAALAALAAFAVFYALGRVTAPTQSALQSAQPLALDRPAPHVPLLGAAAPLPAPPAARHRVRRTRVVRVAAPAPPPPAAPVVRVTPPTSAPARPRLVSGASIGPAGSSAARNVGCARWAAPTGDDGAAGTAAAPFRTVTRLAASLRPGQNGCLTAGTTFGESVKIWKAGRPGRPIKILTAGTPRATIRGSVSVSWRAHDVVLATLRVQGADPRVDAAVTIHGDRTTLVRSEVTRSGDPSATKMCVRIEQADRAVLNADEIHGCMIATRSGARAPGVLVRHARGVQIVNSFVYGVAGAGITLGRGTTRARVVRDIVDGNYGGVAIAGRRNRVVNSIVSNSATWNVRGNTRAHGNVVGGTCLWNGARGQVRGPGVATSGNLFVDPRYLDRAQGLAIGHGPCFSKRPRPYWRSTTNLGTRWPRLPGVTVRWAVRKGPGRVYVESLSFAGLTPNASSFLRCIRGCALLEQISTAGGFAVSTQVDGRWLQTGAVLELREKRRGWVGAYARITVVGGPRGLSVSHACLPPLGGRDTAPCSRYGGAS